MRRSTFFISIQVRGSVSTDTCRDARAVVRSGEAASAGRDDRSIATPAATMTIAMTEAMRTRTDARPAGTAPPAAVIAA